ncbi:hypothetical protein [Streptosporangium lutulentum]|uniref:ABC-2 type transport system permease protein n=1 Tax=Streptosporangium lutulentum TaxID=1461250 RepID=A0ABT9Q630_9ACTN|nr:hypothetical protein [Streptosporangium lutulentum]MDP9841865.1 hypothetical protein [Streptosporangium lutulentum]
MSVRVLGGIALADFRDRVRRPVYAVTLLAAVGLGCLAVPGADSRWVILQIGDHRGVYNSAYVGMATALAGALWLALGGFYVVRGALARDESSGVGRLLASTPLSTTAYLAGKLLSNVLVLASMVGVLAVTALVMQLARGESTTVDPMALSLPFAVIALPLVVVTAAAALLTEALPALRGGFGNVAWFFVWMVVAVGGQGPGAPFGGIGVHEAVESMRTDMLAQGVRAQGEFSLGFTYVAEPLRVFEWGGFTPDADFLLGRLVLVLGAVGCALLPALWFGRFDPARGRPGRRAASPEPAASVAHAEPVVLWSAAVERLPSGSVRTGGSAWRLFTGELRILLRGVSWWWWAGAALISLAGLMATGNGATRVVLPLAWIWPVLIWSRLGTQAHEHGVQALLAATPRARRRLLAEWAAGVFLTAATGFAPALQPAREADWHGVASWTGGAFFIPSLALALGTLSRGHRLFQALYLPLWYIAANGFAVLDYMGATRAAGRPALLHPLAVGTIAAALLGLVLGAGALRRAVGREA